MKAKISKILLLLSVIASVVALSGCVSPNSDQAKKTISQWIPPGTSQADAIQIMKQHGYQCGPCGRPDRQPPCVAVYCFWHETKILKNTRYFFVHFKDGKVDFLDGWGTGNNFYVPRGEPS